MSRAGVELRQRHSPPGKTWETCSGAVHQPEPRRGAGPGACVLGAAGGPVAWSFQHPASGRRLRWKGRVGLPNTHASRPRRCLRRVWSAGIRIAQLQGLPGSSSCRSRGEGEEVGGIKKKKKTRCACALPAAGTRSGLERGGVTCARHWMGRWERGWSPGRVRALAQCGGGRRRSYLARLRGCHRAAWLVSGESAPAY